MKEKRTKKISLIGLVSLGIGSVIGAGIFSMMGTGIGFTGRGIIFALVGAALLVFVQNFFCFVTSSMFELEGGRYEIAARTTPLLISGATAVNFLMQNLSRSVMAIGIAQYIAVLIPSLGGYTQLIAFIVMTFAFAMSLFGNSFIAKMQTVIVLCMYLSLGLFAVFGVLNRNPSAYAGEPFFYGGAAGFLIAMVTVSYACQGAVNVIDVAKDAQNPKKDIPKAILISTLAVAILYAILGYAAVCSMPYEKIANQSLGVVAKEVMPTGLFLFFVIGGAIGALLTTLLGCIAAMPWPILSSAKDGWLPAVFKKVTKKGYPWVVMLTMYLIAVIPIIGDFDLSTIVSYLLVPGSIIAIATNIANFHLPERFGDEWEQKSIPLSIGAFRVCMVISIIASILVAVMSLSTLDTFNLICNLCMTVLLFLWAWYRIKSQKVIIGSRNAYQDKKEK